MRAQTTKESDIPLWEMSNGKSNSLNVVQNRRKAFLDMQRIGNAHPFVIKVEIWETSSNANILDSQVHDSQTLL